MNARITSVPTPQSTQPHTGLPSSPIPPQTATIGHKGAVVLPARLRRRFGLEHGALVLVEEREGGLLLRPALALPLETYTLDEQASFLLSNAVDAQDYVRATENVRAMGLDPDTVPHLKPPHLEARNAKDDVRGDQSLPISNA